MARVLLIDPPLYKHPLWDPIRSSQPLGIWSIGSYLQRLGHTVKVICAPLERIDQVLPVGGGSPTSLDALLHDRLRIFESPSDAIVDRWFEDRSLLHVGLSLPEILAEVDAFAPDIVGIASLATCMHQSFVALARAIRQHAPGVPIIAGGQHATAMTHELLRDAGGAIDLVVLGEGEITTAAVVACLPDLTAAQQLPGIAHLRADGETVSNPRPAFSKIDELALLDPALMSHVPLRPFPVHTFGKEPKRYSDMMFSVGCHKKCPYCYSPVMRGGLRQLSGDKITEQLRQMRAAGYDELVLQDDDLMSNKPFFKGILRAIVDAGLTWQDCGGMELELFDDDIVSAIIASGCTSIYVPVNPRTLAHRLPTKAAVANIHHLKRMKDAGIYTFTSGIYGVPNLQDPAKTYDDVLALRDFHVRLVNEGYVDASLVFPLSALPGTPWFKKVQGNPDFEFDQERWIGYSIFVPQVYPRQVGARRLWREILETHRALNEIQESLPWFTPFPNRILPRESEALPATPTHPLTW